MRKVKKEKKIAIYIKRVIKKERQRERDEDSAKGKEGMREKMEELERERES